MLQSRRREVVLVPQELIVFNNTASDVKEGLALQLSRNGVYPGSGFLLAAEIQDVRVRLTS